MRLRCATPWDQADDDGDGMSDAYEILYGLNPQLASDALDDPDGDGFTSLEESVAGTNPLSSSSVPPTPPDPLRSIWRSCTISNGQCTIPLPFLPLLLN